MGKLIRETDQEKWTDYHLLDPKEFHHTTLPEELGIYWLYLPRECLPNGEGVIYLQIDNHLYAETITYEDIALVLSTNKFHREKIRKKSKIICETEKEKWEQDHCLNPDELRQFLNPCDPRGDWYYARQVREPNEAFAYYFKIGEQLYAEILDPNILYPFDWRKWEWDETTQRMYACARYQLTNTQTN